MKRKNVTKKWGKSILTGVLSSAMVLSTCWWAGSANVTKEISKITAPSALSESIVVTEASVNIADRAIASYSFDSAEEVKNMNNPKYNLSEVKDVPGCGNVLVMGERQRKASYGVEIENPYAGKSELYAETLTDALENNGVIYNGTTADETAIIGDSSTLATFAALDTTIMPLEGRSYPYPKWKKGFTISVWTRVPEGATEDATLFMFKRKATQKGRGGLTVRLNGTTMFYGGDVDEDACRNCYHFDHNMDQIDPLAMAGKWVFVTVTIENDHIGVYFNGVEATGQVDSKHKNGTTLTKMFNKGFGYRDENFKVENPSEAYKNYRDLIRFFTEEERTANDFSDYSQYVFLNSSGESIIEVLTDEEAEFYLGGDNGDSFWGWGEYTDAALGLMFDDLSFFDTVLNNEEIVTLYNQAERKSDDLTATESPKASDGVGETETPKDSEVPNDTEEPDDTEKPDDTEEPNDTEESDDTEKPDDTEEPNNTEVPKGSEEPKDTDVPSASDELTGSEQPSDSQTPQQSEGIQNSQEPNLSQPATGKLGDVDGNGKVELGDAQMALKAALKIITLKPEQVKATDVDENNKIELSDAQKILKAALKIQLLE